MIDFRPDDILNIIQKSPEYASVIKIKYPDLIPEVVSFVLNPNCSCKKKILKFVRNNINEVIEVTNKWIEDEKIDIDYLMGKKSIIEKTERQEMDLTPEQLKFIENRKKKLEEKRKQNNEEKTPKENINISKQPDKSYTRDIRGEVIEIEPNPAAYKKMIRYIHSERWFFEGLSVLETEKTSENNEEEIEVIWLVFFY